MDYHFIVVTPLSVEETHSDRVMLSGVFLRLDSATANGREYISTEGKTIAESLVGMPVYYGAKFVVDPQSLKAGWKHIKEQSAHVGRVIKAVYDNAKKVIKGVIEVWNNEKFPSLVSKIKKGFGFSIGGIIQKFIPTGKINSLGNPVVKAVGMEANHLQLLPPKIPRGQKEARVEEVKPVEETVMFDPCPWGFCTVNGDGVTMNYGETEITVPIEESIKKGPPNPVKRKIENIYIFIVPKRNP